MRRKMLSKGRANRSGYMGVSLSGLLLPMAILMAPWAFMLLTLWKLSQSDLPGLSYSTSRRLASNENEYPHFIRSGLSSNFMTSDAGDIPPHLAGFSLSTKNIKGDSDAELALEAEHVSSSGVGRCGRSMKNVNFVVDDEYAMPSSAEKVVDDHFEFMTFKGLDKHRGAAIGRNREEFLLLHQIIARKCEEAMEEYGECTTGETGFATAASAVTILNAHSTAAKGSAEKLKKSTHYAIDPFQQSGYQNTGARGVANYFHNGGSEMDFFLLNETAALALASFTKARTCFDVLFLDDGHRFEQNIIELTLSIDLVPVGGVIVMHDTWMASIKATRAWIETNLANSIKIVDHKIARNMMVLVKVAPDNRAWDHFAPFHADFANH